MKTTIATKDLIGLLTDLIATAGDGPLAAVHLRTMSGYWRDEPGRTNLLAGVSTSGVVGGHTWALAAGTIEPTVWSVDDAKAVIAVFKPAVKLHGLNHTVDIETTVDRHITVRETPALFDAGSELAFTGSDPADYPYGPVTRALASNSDFVVAGDTGKDAPHTTWNGTAMRALLAVERRRAANLRLWKLPGTGRHLVQIGDEWRGFIFARTVEPDEVDVTEPTPDLNVDTSGDESPEAVAEWSDRMRKGLGIPPIPPTTGDDDGEDPLPDSEEP